MRTFSLLVTPLVLAAAPAQAQNLLTNPDFDANVSGWTIEQDWLSTVWNSDDVAGPPAMGSMIVSNTLVPAGGDGVFQCVGVEAGRSYEASVFAQLPTSQGRTGGVRLRVFWFANPSCDFPSLDSESTGFNLPTNVWQLIDHGGLVAPPGAQSARYDLAVLKNEEGA